MADFDFEPPSFSLGLDLDSDSELQPTASSDPLSQQAKGPYTAVNLRTIEEDEEDGFESPVKVSDPPLTLKRLRRRLTPGLASEAKKVRFEGGKCYVDDDFVEFCSEEDLPKVAGNLPPTSICGSSKASLLSENVVTSESGSYWKSVKGKRVSNASANVGPKGGNVKFPKLTVSPLRRFQLSDSDSDHDDPSVIEDSSKEVPHVILLSKNKESDPARGTEKASVGNPQNEDLWKVFCSEKCFSIPTPAFDETCDEYFSNMKNKSQARCDHLKDPDNERESDGSCLPPAHRYFYHDDYRIQKLVRDRLPYFFPLETGNNLEHKLQNASEIDYIGQFGYEENSRQANWQPVVEKSSTRRKKNIKQSQANNKSQDSNGWVNPKSSARPPKSAGNRRVQAVSNSAGDSSRTSASAGRWYTGSSGCKVYVNKSGQELTGQIAYRHFRKESGMGFKKSKKETAAKKEAAAKKKTAAKKEAAAKKKTAAKKETAAKKKSGSRKKAASKQK